MLIPRMAEEKEPIPIGENWFSSYPPCQHNKSDHHGDQQEPIGGFPNQYSTDVHCGVSFTKRAVRPLSSRGLILPPFPSNVLVQLDSGICDAPLHDSESVPARFAPEGINVEDAHQTFKTDSTDSFNEIAGTLGTSRLRH
jgi:hypothetical protein